MKFSTIAVDAMGGNFAPEEVVIGAVKALNELQGIKLILVGEQEKIEKELELFRYDKERLDIVHASEVIDMEESPLSAMRRKQDASILVATQLVKKGEADAIVTAGSSGAAMASATLYLKRIEGISRPAMAILFPTQHHYTVVLDVGANVDCKPEYLYQFSQLGSIYAQHVLKIAEPKVGLLNIGEEKIKGNQLSQKAYGLLNDSSLNFIGNVEGWDIPRGTADVIVTDGFVGNIVLKVVEGMGELVFDMLRKEIRRDDLNLIQRRFDYAEYGGALLLGINGNCIITHGRSRSPAIVNSIKLAYRSVVSDVVAKTKLFLTNQSIQESGEENE